MPGSPFTNHETLDELANASNTQSPEKQQGANNTNNACFIKSLE